MLRVRLSPRAIATRNLQRGAALVYGLFMLIIALAALFFLFNAGQLTAEKTRLVNTADAVAWSGGVLHARALNTTAYLNRALVANEVLIAQSISLQSWSRMMAGRAETISRRVFPECADRTGRGQLASAALRFGPDYVLMCSALSLPGVTPSVIAATEALDLGVASAIAGIEVNKASIQAAQVLLHAPSTFQSIRADVLREVAQRNYDGMGEVRVEGAGATLAGLSGLTDGWQGAVQRRSGDERARFAEVVRAAVAPDDFVRDRRWTSSAVVPHPICITRRNEVRRRGGTELVDFDTWQAADTESWWLATLRRWRCTHREVVAIGGGAASAEGSAPAEGADAGGDEDAASVPLGAAAIGRTGPMAVGGASENRMAWNRALRAEASTRSSAYTGLPGFHEISEELLGRPDGDPRLDFSIRVVRARGELPVSGGRSAIAPGERINSYDTAAAGDEFAAVAASQVYFARPPDHQDNQYAVRAHGSHAQELASLFNPFWQVRLIDLPADSAAQRLRQARGF